jgi:hypothetical protein
MRYRPLAIAAATAAALLSAVPAHAGIQNVYHDGGDLAVGAAAGNNFRLSTAGGGSRLEPNCFPTASLPQVDVGDVNTSLDLTLLAGTYSIDQILVPGANTGYRVHNTFDTGTINNDSDIDPGQTAINIDAPMRRNPATGTLVQDNVAPAGLANAIIVCISDHEDGGQNEPYAASTEGNSEARDANEVYAKNRPIIRPTIAALGQSAVGPLKTYKLGFGYSIEKWYSLATFADTPPFSVPLRDPNAFSLDKVVPDLTTPDPTDTRRVIDTEAGHVVLPPRINGPRFNAVHDGPGVLRVNDIDIASEPFGDPHFEPSGYGQTTVFNVSGDAQSFCLGGACAGLITIGAQGDLPISWHLKASMASVSSLRTVTFTPAQFDAWEQGWQDYYCGKGPHPTLPLAPATNSPTPRGACPAVNPPEARPTTAPQVQVTVAAPVVSAPSATAPAPRASTCTSKRMIKFVWPKAAKSGKLVYRGRTAVAKRSNGRLRATADLRGMTATPGDYMRVTRHMVKKNGKKSRSTSSYKVC